MDTGVVKERQYDGGSVAAALVGAERISDDLDAAVATFISMRPRLLAIACRILAGTSEAEDVVQETWLRWQKADRSIVSNPQALLTTMTARLAINVSQSAWRRRETCAGSWTPDAVEAGDDPATRAERRDAVEQAVQIMLRRLTPSERAAYILREAFDYPYRQIAETLHLGAANSRQLVSRARRRIAADRSTASSPASHQHLLQTFLSAARAGDLGDLEELLSADLAS